MNDITDTHCSLTPQSLLTHSYSLLTNSSLTPHLPHVLFASAAHIAHPEVITTVLILARPCADIVRRPFDSLVHQQEQNQLEDTVWISYEDLGYKEV